MRRSRSCWLAWELDVQHATTARPKWLRVELERLVVIALVERPHKGEDQSRQIAGCHFFDEASTKLVHKPAERWAAELEERQNQVDGLMVVQQAKARLVGDLLTNGHLANCGRTNDKQQSWRRRSQPAGHAENIVVIYGTTNGFLYRELERGPSAVPTAERPAGFRPTHEQLLIQIEQTCVGGSEPAGVAVEGLQVGLVVDVQPLAARPPGFGRRREHEFTANPTPLVLRVDDGVQYEGMRAAVPAGVHEPDRGASGEGSDPGEAVTL